MKRTVGLAILIQGCLRKRCFAALNNFSINGIFLTKGVLTQGKDACEVAECINDKNCEIELSKSSLEQDGVGSDEIALLTKCSSLLFLT